MATVARKIKVASNPTRRRNAPPRAKAQTTRKKSNPMTAAAKKAFVARMARARKAKSSGRKKAKRRNPTKTVVIATAKRNPSRRRRSNPTAGKRTRSRRRNPSRSNPSIRALIGPPKNLVTQAVVGLLSAVATRQVPQLAMQAQNTGWKGYLANAATGLAATWAAGEFMGPAAGQAALIGASVILLDRVLTEKVSPIGKYLSLAGMGDATAAPKLGTIADGYYIHPTVVDAQGRPIIPHEITDAAMAAARNSFQPIAGQIPAAAMGSVPRGSSRFRSRFGS